MFCVQAVVVMEHAQEIQLAWIVWIHMDAKNPAKMLYEPDEKKI